MKPRILLLFIVLPITLLGAIGAGSHLYGENRWADARERVRHIERKLATMRPRPVLAGPSRDGNAWDHYRRAIEEVPDDAHDRWVKIRHTKHATAAPGDALLADCAASLAMLRKGTRSTHLCIPTNADRMTLSLLACRAIVNVAMLRAARHFERGESARGVEVVLDSLQFGADLSDGPFLIDQMIGLALVHITLEGVAKHLASGIDETDLGRLAGALPTIEARMAAPKPRLLGELVHFASAIGQLDREWTDDMRLHAWRYGLSTAWMFADHVDTFAKNIEAYEAIAARPWADAQPALDAWEQSRASSNNPLTQMSASLAVGPTINRRQTIARIRMMRMAIDHFRGRDVKPLADPFGTELAFEVTDDEVRVSSRGPHEEPSRADKLVIRTTPNAQ